MLKFEPEKSGRNFLFKNASLIVLAFAMSVQAGCSSRYVPVEGSILVDGKPAMEGVQVFFSPLGYTRPAEGIVTGADGQFTMR